MSRAECDRERMKARAKVRELFHRFWTKDAYTPDYDKKAWMELQQQLYILGVDV